MATQEVNSNFVQIYPNPVKNTLNISSDSKLNSFKIFDLSGRILKKGNFESGNKTVDVSALINGNYIIEIETDKGIIRNKFIKN